MGAFLAGLITVAQIAVYLISGYLAWVYTHPTGFLGFMAFLLLWAFNAVLGHYMVAFVGAVLVGMFSQK